jgi:hypothetical protein
MKVHQTANKRPTKRNANSLGYVFARRVDRVGFDGVLWDRVEPDTFPEWAAADPAHYDPKTGFNPRQKK